MYQTRQGALKLRTAQTVELGSCFRPAKPPGPDGRTGAALYCTGEDAARASGRHEKLERLVTFLAACVLQDSTCMRQRASMHIPLAPDQNPKQRRQHTGGHGVSEINETPARFFETRILRSPCSKPRIPILLVTDAVRLDLSVLRSEQSRVLIQAVRLAVRLYLLKVLSHRVRLDHHPTMDSRRIHLVNNSPQPPRSLVPCSSVAQTFSRPRLLRCLPPSRRGESGEGDRTHTPHTHARPACRLPLHQVAQSLVVSVYLSPHLRSGSQRLPRSWKTIHRLDGTSSVDQCYFAVRLRCGQRRCGREHGVCARWQDRNSRHPDQCREEADELGSDAGGGLLCLMVILPCSSSQTSARDSGRQHFTTTLGVPGEQDGESLSCCTG